MTTAVCPGSFDPPTNGHMDVIRRSVSVFDRVVVAVIRNLSKTPMFTSEERIEMLDNLFADEPRVEVASFDGLLVDFARTKDVSVIVKGLRAVSDFDYELQMAQMNHRLSESILYSSPPVPSTPTCPPPSSRRWEASAVQWTAWCRGKWDG